MLRRIIKLALVALCLCVTPTAARGQEFKIFDHTIQVHGFVSQGFVYTNDNNWLTMNTSQGSAAFTDFGLNMSAPLTDRLHVGAQIYDRNLGQLGQYHPSLDWAVVDYRFKSWFGVRGGKVKTTLGLYNDTQDLDFLHTFALLPQSMYPTPTFATPQLHTWEATFTETSLSTIASGISRIRHTRDTAATALIAVTLISYRGLGPFLVVSAVCSTEATSVGIPR